MANKSHKPLAKCRYCGGIDRLNQEGHCSGCQRIMRERERRQKSKSSQAIK